MSFDFNNISAKHAILDELFKIEVQFTLSFIVTLDIVQNSQKFVVDFQEFFNDYECVSICDAITNDDEYSINLIIKKTFVISDIIQIAKHINLFDNKLQLFTTQVCILYPDIQCEFTGDKEVVISKLNFGDETLYNVIRHFQTIRFNNFNINTVFNNDNASLAFFDYPVFINCNINNYNYPIHWSGPRCVFVHCKVNDFKKYLIANES